MPPTHELTTPRLGICTLLGMILLELPQLAWLVRPLENIESHPTLVSLWLANSWALVAIAAAIFYGSEFRVWPWGLGTLMITLQAVMMRWVLGPQYPVQRYGWLFGLLAILIIVGAKVAALPAWQLGWRFRREARPMAAQFSIRAMLIITALTALSMTLDRYYSWHKTGPAIYFVLLFAVLGSLAASTVLSRKHMRWRVLCLVIVTVLGTIFASWLTHQHAGAGTNVSSATYSLGGYLVAITQSHQVASQWVTHHILVVGGFVICVCVVYALGRLDQSTFERLQSESIDAPDAPESA